jgi:hypothetical protein
VPDWVKVDCLDDVKDVWCEEGTVTVKAKGHGGELGISYSV